MKQSRTPRLNAPEVYPPQEGAQVRCTPDKHKKRFNRAGSNSTNYLTGQTDWRGWARVDTDWFARSFPIKQNYQPFRRIRLSAQTRNYGDVLTIIFFHHKDTGCGMDSIFSFFYFFTTIIHSSNYSLPYLWNRVLRGRQSSSMALEFTTTLTAYQTIRF